MTSNLPIAASRVDQLSRSEVLATFFRGVSPIRPGSVSWSSSRSGRAR